MSIHIPFSQRKRFWVNFIQALNATPLETNKFLGATGIEHPVLRAGLDNKKQRLILISADNSPRITALAQSDIQAAYPTLQVLAVQPVIISHEDLTNPKKDLETILEEVRQGAQLCISELEPTTPNEYLKEALAITANMYFKDITSYMDTPSMGLYLKEAAKINQEEAARKLGICPLPIYNFSIEQLELVIDDSQPNKTKEILHYHNIIQYFFPHLTKLLSVLSSKHRIIKYN